MQFENEQYDCVIVGTSLYKSILSAALARAGQKVLHVDPNPFYGSSTESSLDLSSYRSGWLTQKLFENYDFFLKKIYISQSTASPL